MRPIVPPSLSQGSRIQLVAPAGPVERNDVERGRDWLARRFQVDLGEGVFDRDGYFAGGHDRRRRELQGALDDRSIRAIVSARGGFGVSDLIDGLDFVCFLETPKWVVGSSDMTALLVHLYAVHRCLSIHGPMAAGFHRTEPHDLELLVRLLEGHMGEVNRKLTGHRNGRAEGPLIGGNLTVFAHLMGSLDPHFADGAILFLEDVGERPYRLDRCMVQLGRAGVLERVVGVVLGELTACEPGPDGVDAETAVLRHLLPLRVPVAAGYPAAHGQRNAPFVHGAVHRLEVEASVGSIRPV